MNIVSTVYTVVVALSSCELLRGVVTSRRTRTSPLHADERSEHGVFVRGTMEAAFLSGGPARVADALIAGLHEDGRLVVAGPGVVGITRPTARNAAEQAVLDAHTAAPSGALHWLRLGVMRSAPVQETGDALARRGLVVRPGSQRKWRRWAGLQTFLSLFGFIAVAMLTTVEHAEDSYPGYPGSGSDSLYDSIVQLVPVGLIGVVTGLICLYVTEKRLTVAGRRALYEYVRSSGHLTGAAHLVATHGLSAVHPDLRRHLMASARVRVPAPPPMSPHLAPYRTPGTGSPSTGSPSTGTPTWCGSGGGGGGGGGGGCSGGSGGSCSSGGSSCSGGGSSCGGGGSSCGGGGSSCGGGGGSSCGGGGGSSCSSS